MKSDPVHSGDKLLLKLSNPDDTGGLNPDRQTRERTKKTTRKLISKLSRLQERLYANSSRSLLIVLQGMDTSGKDSTIKHVMSGVNPQGCRVATFKTPSYQELDHDFLWRVHQHVPAKGQIVIFNRSHYEDVLITRVHGLISDKTLKQRFEQIQAFESLLAQNGTAIVKFFLHISKNEQKKRLLERINNPEKRWKFCIGDLEERKLWDHYQTAFEIMLAATSTDYAPWHVIPANHKWYRNLIIAKHVVSVLKAMRLKTPPARAEIDFETLKIE